MISNVFQDEFEFFLALSCVWCMVSDAVPVAADIAKAQVTPGANLSSAGSAGYRSRVGHHHNDDGKDFEGPHYYQLWVEWFSWYAQL